MDKTFVPVNTYEKDQPVTETVIENCCEKKSVFEIWTKSLKIPVKEQENLFYRFFSRILPTF